MLTLPLMVDYASHAQPVNDTCSVDPLQMTPILSQAAFLDNEKSERMVSLHLIKYGIRK